MRREKMVLGLGPGSKRVDGSQDDVVFWDDEKDLAETTEWHHEIKHLGWDISTFVAKLKTGEYIFGDAHSSMCGRVVEYSTFWGYITEEADDLEKQAKFLRCLTEL